MSDTLRDRITAAVLTALNEHCLNGGRISSEFIHHDDDPYPSLRILDDDEIAARVAPLAADAVIAELGLEVDLTYSSDDKTRRFFELRGFYQMDWKADDE